MDQGDILLPVSGAKIGGGTLDVTRRIIAQKKVSSAFILAADYTG